MVDRNIRSFARKSEFRDAKFIVIACEGSNTEPKYFEDLALDERFRNPRVHIEILISEETLSAPNRVVDRLTVFEDEYELVEGDELWIVIDKDNWKDSTLSLIAQQVSQKGFHLADSNPCFELWLLLHHRPLDSYTECELKELKENRKVRFRSSRRRIELELIEECGSYNKSNPKESHYIPRVRKAIENSSRADRRRNDVWLDKLGSRVYKLAQVIINSSQSRNNPSH